MIDSLGTAAIALGEGGECGIASRNQVINESSNEQARGASAASPCRSTCSTSLRRRRATRRLWWGVHPRARINSSARPQATRWCGRHPSSSAAAGWRRWRCEIARDCTSLHESARGCAAVVKVCAPGPALEMLLDSGVETRGTNRPLLQRVRSALHLHFTSTPPRLASPQLSGACARRPQGWPRPRQAARRRQPDQVSARPRRERGGCGAAVAEGGLPAQSLRAGRQGASTRYRPGGVSQI